MFPEKKSTSELNKLTRSINLRLYRKIIYRSKKKKIFLTQINWDTYWKLDSEIKREVWTNEKIQR